MRISDWSSDVCSSDLAETLILRLVPLWRHSSASTASFKLHLRGSTRIKIRDAVPSAPSPAPVNRADFARPTRRTEMRGNVAARSRSEEHTSELQSLMRISYAVFCLKKKTISKTPHAQK